MKIIELERENLNKEFFENVLFFMIAEGGAMGEPGAIKFIKTDGNLYHLNYVFGDFKIEEVLVAFPVLGECDFGMFGMDSKIPEGWNYVNLGMGNYLIVKSEVFPPFKKLIRKYKSAGEVYQNWIDHADYIINSKGEIKMKNNVTELVFILDKSGSMSGLEADTIGGFNSMIAKQKKLDGKVIVSTVLFDDEIEVLHDRVDIQGIKPMTDEEYTIGGCTALLDAIGGAIHHIGNIHKYARPEDVPEHTMFIITTDGQENASHNYTSDRVKKMIRRQEECYGWEFLFVAANIDAVETAKSIGIRRERAANYNYSKKGTRNLYDAVDCAVTSMRNCEAPNENWKKELEKE